MITFNPGPSQLSPETVEDIKRLASDGTLSISHRSQEFSDMSRQTIESLRNALHIPEDFHIFYHPSATAAMETVLGNLMPHKSFHFVHGAFSQRFWQTALDLDIEASAYETPWNKGIAWKQSGLDASYDFCAITHNETSSGLMWPQDEISQIRKQFPDMLLAVDATSSLGGVVLDFSQADIWFASVQKCLGLPAGMGLLIVNERTLTRCRNGRLATWRRFDKMHDMMDKFQTFETPNVFAIALLGRQMQRWDINAQHEETCRKARLLYGYNPITLKPFIEDAPWRSATVVNFNVADPTALRAKARQAGLILGSGYGKLKSSCIRIANFPSISEAMLRNLLESID